MLQPAGPLPGRLEEINRLTRRFGLGDEWLTDWKLEESQLRSGLSVETGSSELPSVTRKYWLRPRDASADPSGFTLKPTVKREENPGVQKGKRHRGRRLVLTKDQPGGFDNGRDNTKYSRSDSRQRSRKESRTDQ